METQKVSAMQPQIQLSTESPIKSDNFNDFPQKKRINILDIKARDDKEKTLFSYINQQVTKDRKIDPAKKKVATCCGCCSKKPVPPDMHPSFDFKQTSDPDFKLSKVVIIYNPFSGNGKGKKNLPIMEKCLKENKIEIIKIIKTEKHNHAIEIAHKEPLIDQVDAVFCTGGDGTLKEIVNGLVLRAKEKGEQKLKVVGYVPGGTANDMGITLYGLKERYHVQQLMEKIIKGKPYYMDIMEIQYTNQKNKQEEVEYAHMLATWGLGVNANVTAESLRCFGPLRYDLGIVYHILKGGIKKFIVQIDDKPECEIETQLMMIVNNQYVADQLRTTPFAKIDDGYLELILFENQGRIQTFKCFDELKRNGSHVYDEKVIYGQFKKIKFRTETPTMIQLDGESDKHLFTPVTVEVKSNFMQILH